MIQAAMFFALGLLAAALLALLVTPAIWRRAMRLARARIEASVPMTRAEIDADRDQVRAGFAVANRRLELNADRLSEKLAKEVIEVGRRREEIAALSRRQAELGQAVGRLEAQVVALTQALSTYDGKLAAANAEIALRDQRLGQRAAALAAVETNLAASEQKGEEQRVELVARDTAIGNFTDQLVAAVAAGNRLAAELATERERLAAEQRRAAGLEAGIGALGTERAETIAERDRRAAEVGALETEIAAERTRREALAAELDAVRAHLAAELKRRSDLEASLAAARAERIDRSAELDRRAAEVTTLAAEVAADGGAHAAVAVGDNLEKAIAAAEAEKQELVARLARLGQELADLRAENAELRGVAGAEWESDRQQNQHLRARLDEIATNVVRLTQSLTREGAGRDGNGTRREPESFTRQHASKPDSSAAAGEPQAQPDDGPTPTERLRALQRAGAGH
ncbi:MAG: hypothetical protein WD036_02535 [Bauldia sp.]